MKSLITVLILSTRSILLCQIASTEKLNLEWRKEVTGGGITGILPGTSTLLIATMAGVSQLNSGGTEINFSKSSSGVYTLEKYKGKVYTVGYMHLEERSLLGLKVKDIALYQSENTPLSAQNGIVYNDYLYTTNIDRYFFKFDLNGNKISEKEIAELSVNKFLQVGGGKIYIYSLLNKPALGGRLMQYDTLGNQKWSIAPGSVNNILADKDGNCYAFILVAQKSNIVNKYNSLGELIWSKEVPNQTVSNGFVYGDTLFTCGIQTIESAAGGEQNPVFSILSASDGKVINQQMFDFYQGDEGYGECFTQIAYDGKALYLGGSSGSYGYVRSFLVKLSSGNPTGLSEGTSKTSFSIFPNPGGSQFSISCGQSDISTLNVTVRNISGQVVYKKQISCNDQKTFTLDLGKQAAGNYSVEIVSGKDKTVKKIVVE